MIFDEDALPEVLQLIGIGVSLTYYTMFSLPVIPVLILVKLLLEHGRKQFRFYYAKACFRIIGETKSETDKAGYLSLGLDWYNKVVKGATKFYDKIL